MKYINSWNAVRNSYVHRTETLQLGIHYEYIPITIHVAIPSVSSPFQPRECSKDDKSLDSCPSGNPPGGARGAEIRGYLDLIFEILTECQSIGLLLLLMYFKWK